MPSVVGAGVVAVGSPFEAETEKMSSEAVVPMEASWT